jgi:hypothetical protein
VTLSVDTEKPTIRALIAWPRLHGHVFLSKQQTVTLEEAVDYKRLGFAVLVDPADERLLAEWERDQIWYNRRKWL